MKDEYIEWGDWKEGDEVVFCGFSNPAHGHWTFTIGNTYVVTRDGSSLAPLSEVGGVPVCNWGFRFKRKEPDTSSEALQDTLALVDTDVPDQGENFSESITEGITITPSLSFSLTIKGQEFVLNEQELKELYNQLCYAEGKLHDFNLGD